MSPTFHALTVRELLALAVEASKRGDSGRSIEYLKEAVQRPDASGPACFLLGSEYAQIGLVNEALEQFEAALRIDPGFAIARFQFGLLRFTLGQVEAARAVWEPLKVLGGDHPLVLFAIGLEHAAAKDVSSGVAYLTRGLQAQPSFASLNTDMARLIERLRAEAGDAGAAASQDDAEGHLLLNAYTRGQVH